jgi:hypothetical protein
MGKGTKSKSHVDTIKMAQITSEQSVINSLLKDVRSSL